MRNDISIINDLTVLIVIMNVLNVAEKNDAAKNIAAYLSRGAYKRVIKKSFQLIIKFIYFYKIYKRFYKISYK